MLGCAHIVQMKTAGVNHASHRNQTSRVTESRYNWQSCSEGFQIEGWTDMASIEERVTGIVVELLGVEEERVVANASFREDLEADSLDLVELIMAFEEEFGGEISDEDAQRIETVGQAVEYIQSNME